MGITKEQPGWEDFHSHALAELDPALEAYGWKLQSQVNVEMENLSRSYECDDRYLRVSVVYNLKTYEPFEVAMWTGSEIPDTPVTLIDYVEDKRAGELAWLLRTDEVHDREALKNLTHAITFHARTFLEGELRTFDEREELWKKRLAEGTRPVSASDYSYNHTKKQIVRYVVWIAALILVFVMFLYVNKMWIWAEFML